MATSGRGTAERPFSKCKISHVPIGALGLRKGEPDPSAITAFAEALSFGLQQAPRFFKPVGLTRNAVHMDQSHPTERSILAFGLFRLRE